jgi:D-tyrosyl-tRNA(Tyr) deacylase
VVLVGVVGSDTENDAQYLAQKTVGLRIFPDEEGKFNLSALDVEGELLIVSQFTLLADARKGRRPSYDKAAHPDLANELYEYFVEYCNKIYPRVKAGVFGAIMKVSLVNDGPVTLIVKSKNHET